MYRNKGQGRLNKSTIKSFRKGNILQQICSLKIIERLCNQIHYLGISLKVERCTYVHTVRIHVYTFLYRGMRKVHCTYTMYVNINKTTATQQT